MKCGTVSSSASTEIQQFRLKYCDGGIVSSGASYHHVHSQGSARRYMSTGADEQLPSSSATLRFGNRSSTPPPHRQAVTNWMPSGWLNVCQSISLSSTSRPKSGVRYVWPPPWNAS